MASIQSDVSTAFSALLQKTGRWALLLAGPYEPIEAARVEASTYAARVSAGIFEWRIVFHDDAAELVELACDTGEVIHAPVRAGVAAGLLDIPPSCKTMRIRLPHAAQSLKITLELRRLDRFTLAARALALHQSRRAILSRWKTHGFVAAARALIAASRGVTTESYQSWIAAYERPFQDQALIDAWLKTLPDRPLISVVTPVYETRGAWLRVCLDSVRAQSYPHWEHCLVDDCSPSAEPFETLQQSAQSDERFRVQRRATNGGIAAATNDAIALAHGAWIAFLDHDDSLSTDALALAAAAINANPDARIIYTDEDKIDEAGARSEPYLKGEWDPILFAGQNYLNHLTLIRRDLIEEVGGLRSAFDGSQDYDLLLRCDARVTPAQIKHIPAIAYHWRFGDGRNFSLQQAEKTQTRMRASFADNNATGARLEPARDGLPYPHLFPAPPTPAPLVSIIIPTRDGAALLDRCVKTLKEKADWLRCEFIIMDNESTAPDALALFTRLKQDGARIERFPGAFNFSAINNAGARIARGEILAFINNDVEAKSAGWLLEMVRWFGDESVVGVGAKLLYPDGRIQHAGIVTGIAGSAGHLYKYREGVDAGPFGRLARARAVSALTAACMLVRADAFREIGGFDESCFPIAFNDVDLCLRLREGGRRLVWTPDAVLIHHESATRGADDADPARKARFETERAALQTRWNAQLEADPHYSPNLTLADESGTLAWPPRYRRPWAG